MTTESSSGSQFALEHTTLTRFRICGGPWRGGSQVYVHQGRRGAAEPSPSDIHYAAAYAAGGDGSGGAHRGAGEDNGENAGLGLFLFES